MDSDRPKLTQSETAAALAGLAAVALPSTASAQKSPNISPPTMRAPSISPSPSPRFQSIPSSGGERSVEPAGQQPAAKKAAKRSVGETLRSLPRSGRLQAYEKADGRLLLVENGQAFLLETTAAADGRYELSLSGTIQVQAGRAIGVSGRPGAVMIPSVLP